MGLHPLFAEILVAHGAPIGQRAPVADTYRGWTISYDCPPIPCRQFDWSATHPDFDGEGDDRVVHGRIRADVIAAIDAWYDEVEL